MTLEETLAIAICDGFWESAELPERWATTPEMKRQVFRNCARKAIEAARKFKATSTAGKEG
jgi:hypothetical protein